MSDTTAMFGYVQYDATELARLDTLFNDAVQSIEDNSPHQYAPTISAINAASGPTHPNGQVVILTADNAGVKAGALFKRAANKWWFAGGQVANIATFLGTLSSNLGTEPGASFYDLGDSLPKVFITGTGAWRVTAPTPRYATITKTTALQKIRTVVDPVTFQTVAEGDSAFFSSADQTHISIPDDGRYAITAQIRVNSGNIEIAYSIGVNDVIIPRSIINAGDRNAIAWPTCRGTFEVDLSAGDKVSVHAQRFGGVDSQFTTDATWVQIRKVLD